jgi:hypothetical protein
MAGLLDHLALAARVGMIVVNLSQRKKEVCSDSNLEVDQKLSCGRRQDPA